MFFSNEGQFCEPGIISFKLETIWQPLQTPRVKLSVLEKYSENSSFALLFRRIEFAQPLPAPKTSPYEKPPHAANLGIVSMICFQKEFHSYEHHKHQSQPV